MTRRVVTIGPGRSLTPVEVQVVLHAKALRRRKARVGLTRR